VASTRDSRRQATKPATQMEQGNCKDQKNCPKKTIERTLNTEQAQKQGNYGSESLKLPNPMISA
jgi:hypothetical protein